MGHGLEIELAPRNNEHPNLGGCEPEAITLYCVG